jgi:probable F420-dependent oxidoreductase
LAKVTASLDYASDGRFIFGVGTGWNLEEMANHGTDPRTRTALLRERVRAIKEIWTKEEAEFHGEFVDFDPIFSWPKPKQVPHPPVLVGGGGPSVLGRVVDYGDGWFPGHQKDLDELGARMAELQAMAADAGRSPIPVSIMFGLPGCIPKYEEMGVDRVVFGISPGPIATVYRELDELAAAARLR